MPATCEVIDVVRRLIADNFLYREGLETFGDAESLLESGVMDSTGVLELLMLLESTFSIRVANEEVVPENLDSIDLIVAFVARKRPTHVDLVNAL